MRKNTIAIAITVVFILVLGAFYYVKLGGLEEVNYRFEQAAAFEIHGKKFEGKYKSKQLENLFYEMRKHVEDSVQIGSLAIVNFELPEEDKKKGVLKQIIGLHHQGEMPEKWQLEKHQFEAAQWIKAEIKAHNFVMPQPEDVKEKALELAQEKGFGIKEYSLELYYTNRDLVIYFPLYQLPEQK